MSSPRNEIAYAKEFVGNLRGKSEPVPAQVNTTVRVMRDLTDSEAQVYKGRSYDTAPRYFFGSGNLPSHPNVKASGIGRHFFSW